MKIIDLSEKIFVGMKVYPGDPEFEMNQIESLENGGWNVSRFCMNTHDSTHINFPYHCHKSGKKSDEYTIDDFIGLSYVYKKGMEIEQGVGYFFLNNSDLESVIDEILDIKPKFIGMSNLEDINEEIEKTVLKNNILCYERIKNLEKISTKFMFHGIPLNFLGSDGSPVRAYAVI